MLRARWQVHVWLHGRVAAALALALIVTVHGSATAQTVVVEAHVQSRGSDFARLIKPVVRSLEGAGALPMRDAARRFDQERSRESASAEDAADLQNQVRQLMSSAKDAWSEADFGRARKLYRRAMEVVRSAPSDAIGDSSWKPLVKQVIVGLALAAKRGEDLVIAEAAMVEFMRSYPDEVVDRATFGPEAAALYDSVKSGIAKRPKGRLSITVDVPDVVVFLNDHYAGVGSITIDGLIPGPYRVHVRKGDNAGRIYDVMVRGGSETTLKVDWNFDSALVTDEWLGFVFPDEESKARLLRLFAVHLGKTLGATTVVVLESSNGGRVLVGSVLSVESWQPTLTASMEVSPAEPSPEQLATLGRYLAGVEGVTLDEGGAPHRSRTKTILLWGGVGVGAAAVIAGVYVLTLHGDCGGSATNANPCSTLGRTTGLGIGLAGVGAATLAVSAYYMLRRPAKRAPVVSASSDHVVLGLAGSF